MAAPVAQHPVSPIESRAVEDPCTQEYLDRLFSEIGALAVRLKQVAWYYQIPGGLPIGGKTVLQILARYGSKTVPQVARLRSTSRQNIQVLVNRLLKDGYVEPVHNPAHKRSPFVQLTQQGREALKASSQNEQSFVESLLPHIARAEVASALKLLSQIQRLLAEKGQPPEAPSLREALLIGEESSITWSPKSVKPSMEEVSTYGDLPFNLL